MIRQYRKKPVAVSAVQWSGSAKSSDEIISWSNGKVRLGASEQGLYVKTLEGEMKASPGDFVIKGILGEFYPPCKPDIFERVYEAIAEDVYISPEKIRCAPTCEQCQHKSSCDYGLPALPEKEKCGCEAGQCKKCSKEFEYPVGPAFACSTLSTGHRPYVCPVCNGAGTVSRPPHIAGDQTTWSSTSCPLYTCHACCGTGVVWG